MKRNTFFDYSRRISRGDGYYGKGHLYGVDCIEGLNIPWDYEIASIDGAHYHCWIKKGLNKIYQTELLNKFSDAANYVGDVVYLSWDYIPEGGE